MSAVASEFVVHAGQHVLDITPAPERATDRADARHHRVAEPVEAQIVVLHKRQSVRDEH